MNAFDKLVEYLEQHEMYHVDTIIDLALKVLSERRPLPKVFAVMPVQRFEELFSYQESNIISQFQLPVDLGELGNALRMMSAGICIRTQDKVIIPYPSITIHPYKSEI